MRLACIGIELTEVVRHDKRDVRSGNQRDPHDCADELAISVFVISHLSSSVFEPSSFDSAPLIIVIVISI